MKTLEITFETATAAFAEWESDFRSNPKNFMTPDEVAACETGSLAEQRAAYFMGLFRKVQGVVV